MPGNSCANATRPEAVAPPCPNAYTSMPIHTAYSATTKATNAMVTRAMAGSRTSARMTRKNRLTSRLPPGWSDRTAGPAGGQSC